jgi:hypothetical protein
MTNPNLHPISKETFHQLTPSIIEAWRTDPLHLCLAHELKESIEWSKDDQKRQQHRVTTLAYQWLKDYVVQNHSATAPQRESIALVVTLYLLTVIKVSELLSLDRGA